MKGLFCLGSIALLFCLLGGCSSQTSASNSSTTAISPGRAQSAPLQEPFASILSRWNYYRAAAGVPRIAADPALNQAALHHAKYLVMNHLGAGDGVVSDDRLTETGWNASAHSESVGNRWYTEDGEKWARGANVIRGSTVPTDGAAMVDEQVARADSLAVLNPQLAAVGFGLHCAKDDCAGVIVYRYGLPKAQFFALYEGNAMDWNALLGTMPYTVARLRKPLEFPSGAIEFPVRAYRGGEFPDVLSGCSGYSVPAGVPIVLELGAPASGEDVKIASDSLKDGSMQLETCSFDAASYANPDGYQQGRARELLHAAGAVVVIPKNPLQPGHKYEVSIVADSQPYSWSFSVAPDAK